MKGGICLHNNNNVEEKNLIGYSYYPVNSKFSFPPNYLIFQPKVCFVQISTFFQNNLFLASLLSLGFLVRKTTLSVFLHKKNKVSS